VKGDSAPHFALFTAAPTISGFSLGGSGDFRWSPLPVPLRLSLAFSNEDDKSYGSGPRKAMATLELVMRPIPKKLGIQPYFLGGVGVGTTAAGFGSFTALASDDPLNHVYLFPRETSAFFSLGVGLDIGKMFIEMKGASPIANNARTMYNPVNIGFRFWD
jgi:hypothetical protein